MVQGLSYEEEYFAVHQSKVFASTKEEKQKKRKPEIIQCEGCGMTARAGPMMGRTKDPFHAQKKTQL